uniref:Agrin n=1 Tax=Denticeps clupeoides TaxID=299321 RepID=A0AAY4E4W4_9TELE
MGRQRGRGARWCGLPVAALLLAALGAPCAGLCSEKALQRREEEANVVLTGTVEEIMNMDPVHNTYSCKVRVWRYLKGKTMVNGEVLLDGGNKVMIGGFGDPGICDNQVSTGDTRIFFVNLAPRYMWPAHKNELMLNSSLMRITLRNLEEVENYVEGTEGTHFPLPPGPPRCRGMLCGFGAVCEKNSADPSKGECVCKKMTCQSVVAPVCGSDSSTYSNECELEKAQCNTQRRIKVLRKGPCSLKDPCSEMNCTYGSTCIQSSDGLSAKCMCPLSCDNLPWQTVCGSDGKDYSSECELHRKACENQRNVRVQFTGPCNPCKATGSTVCRVEPLTRKAILGPQTCSMSASPVCASDGNTYLSECQMTQTAMETKTDLRVIHTGVCRKQEQCKDECKFNGVCLVEGSSARCSCEPIHCDGTYNPLCGSDGSTYPNVCEKRKAECLSRAHISTNHSGPCDLDMPSPCLKKKCHFGAACVVQNGEPVCECPNACPQAREPVCGSDGQTYGSRCEMHAMSCALQKEIHVLRPGPCVESCLNCSFGGICDGQTGKCVCPTECVDIHQPVCGSDGVTYENECKLNVKACTKQLDLKVVAREEYCGSGGSGSGESSCGAERCRLFGGSWDDDAEDDRCVCDFSCQNVPRSQLCGIDGRTYNNECELKKAQCERQEEIVVDKQGPCKAPPVSPVTSVSHCSQTVYGCCQDNKTAALGVGGAGCPETCQCNSYGSYRGTCDPATGQCSCKPGVGGLKCDRCEPGFWNFRAIVTANMSGCTPCNCDAAGSVRDDCEQMTGLCSCKPGLKGLRCSVCPDGSSVGASGCNKAPAHCANVLCKFGASCVELNGHAHCECPSPDCDLPSKTKVCGTDGVTYADECQLRTIACRQDKDIKVKHTGQCTGESINKAHSTQAHAYHYDNVNNINYVEAPAPLRPPTSAPSTTAKRPTTTIAKVPHKMPPPTLIRLDTGIEESGSGLSSGDDDEEDGGSGSEASGDEPSGKSLPFTTCPTIPERSSCDNTAFGCCPDGRTMAINPEGDNCPPTMRFSGFLHLDQVEGQEVFYTPEMEDPKSELFGETARSIESALSELFRKSDVQKDFKSVRVRNLAPSNSILAFVEAHFNPDTRFTLDEVQGALLKQIASRIMEGFFFLSLLGLPSLPYFTTMTTMVAAVTTPTPHTTTHYLNNVALTTHRLPFTRRPFTSHHTTTVAPETNWHQTTTPPPVHPTSHHVVHTKPGQPCDSQPCQHGGSCENSDTDFTCICPAGRGGILLPPPTPLPLSLAFGGKSYLAFPTMKAYHTVRIAMEFRTSEMNGILLYNGQSGKKDFLSLALIDGKVELRWVREPRVGYKKHTRYCAFIYTLVPCRFNTGSGTCSVVSKTKVKQGSWHQLVVTRNRRTGILSVDGEEEIRGQSPPGTDGLNLDTDLFIGGIPEDLNPDVKERTSISTGLHGCIRLLDVNNMVYNLQEKDGNVLYGSGVGECGNNPCLPNPCRNGAMCQIKEAEVFHCKCVNGFSGHERCPWSSVWGRCFVQVASQEHLGPTCADAHNPCDPNKCHPSAQCQVLPEGGYKCECPMGREGRHCEKVSDRRGAYIPFFAGDSFLELKGLHLYGHDLRQKVSMSVVLMAEDPNGMIFYNGQKTDGKGDFISLALNDGILEFRYDLGKGPAVIRSREKIKMKQWTTVNLERANRKGEININGKDPVKGESPNQHTDLNLKESFLVGGAPDFRKLARASALKDGFKGAIQKVRTQTENALNSRDVSMFSEHPCSKDTCLNGGRCNPLLDSYECVCLHGFTGTHCENTIFEKSAGESEAIAFDGRTFIEYHNGVTKSEKALLVNKFELSIKTEATQGLILWSGKGVERSDYIALAIVDGRVQMTYDLGSKPVVLRSSVRVNTNRWIRIKASRALRDGSLQVGNEAAVTGSSPLAATQLDTDGALWLGGLEELGVARRLPKAYSTGFVGCVKDVLVDGVELHLVEDALNSPKILHCSAK